MATTVGTAGALARPRRRLFTQQTIEGYACILPWLIGFLCFVAGPMVAALVISFLDWSMLAPPEWAGHAQLSDFTPPVTCRGPRGSADHPTA